MLKTPKKREPVTVGTVDPGNHLLEPKPKDELTHSLHVCYEAPVDQIVAVCLSSNNYRSVLQMTPTVLTSHHEAPLKSLQYHTHEVQNPAAEVLYLWTIDRRRCLHHQHHYGIIPHQTGSLPAHCSN